MISRPDRRSLKPDVGFVSIDEVSAELPKVICEGEWKVGENDGIPGEIASLVFSGCFIRIETSFPLAPAVGATEDSVN